MKLSLTQLKNITQGAVRVIETEGKVSFHRFTENEESYYKAKDIANGRRFSERCLAAAGIKLSFKTNSKSLKISALVNAATSRSYFSFDVFENDKLIGYLDNFNVEELFTNYTEQEFPLGIVQKTFNLSNNEKQISIYFPWSVYVENFEFFLDDGAMIEPICASKKILVYGDSISQGYDAIRPSNRYVAKIANYLGAEELNKAIGGEVFDCKFINYKVDFKPDYVLVAYGTNDWNGAKYDSFKFNAKNFFSTLVLNYPNSIIFVITPIWRKDYRLKKEFGKFNEVEKTIQEICSNYEKIKVINGFNLVPHSVKNFADLRLHPNDKGFNYYFKNLKTEIDKHINN